MVLVAGATGVLGSEIVRRLRERGREVCERSSPRRWRPEFGGREALSQRDAVRVFEGVSVRDFVRLTAITGPTRGAPGRNAARDE